MNYRLGSFLGLVLLSAPVRALEIGTELTLQSAYGDQRWVQSEGMLDLDINHTLAVGELTGIARFRLDAVDEYNLKQPAKSYASHSRPLLQNNDGQLGLRELYWAHGIGKHYWRLGKQQVVWGEADGLKLLDVVNPQSFREFILDDTDDARIPLWMLNYQYQTGASGNIQLLLIADTTVHELASSHSPFALRTPLVMPQLNAGIDLDQLLIEDAKAPKGQSKNGDIGVRYTGFLRGWDVSLNYLYHMIDEPIVRVVADGSRIVVSPEFERSHLFGGSLSSAFDSWVVRMELAYETDRYVRTRSLQPGVHRSDQVSTVAGFDWQGWSNQFLSLQWFHRYLLSYNQDALAEKHENTLTALWQYALLNETLNLEWLHLHSVDRDDGVAQLKLRYNVLSNSDIYFGYDRFYGSEDGLFGQYDGANRFIAGIKMGF